MATNRSAGGDGVDQDRLAIEQARKYAEDLTSMYRVEKERREELERAQVDMRASEDRYRQLFEEAPVMYVITEHDADTEPLVVDCNTAFLKTVGKTRAEIVGSRLVEFYSEFSREQVLRSGGFRRAPEGVLVAEERQLVGSDGQVIQTLLRATPMRDGSGRVTGTRAMFVDITEKKQAERLLRESEERYRSIFDNSALLIQSCDPQGKFIFANPAWLETLGYSELELQAMNVFDVIHPRSTEHCQQIFQCIMAGEEVGTIEATFRTRQGDPVEVRGKVSTQLADGQVVATHSYFEDVTETKKMEQQLLRAQRLETIGSLASGVAHDLNNVLSPIMMSVQILRQKMPDEQSKKLLARLEANVKRGASIIKQVLTFARGGEGERSTVQVRHLMKDVAAICEETFPKSISLSVEVARDLWPVSADATQLHQVLMNLCINARDAMPDGGSLSMKAANVDITQERTHMGLTIAPGSFVVVTVSDSGTGIDEEELERIFEPFYTTKEVGKGTGLGLASVINIARNHGGMVEVSSKPGLGTSMSFYVPADPDAITDAEGGSLEALARGDGETVLVIDDEATLRDVTTETLELHGYRSLTASDGAEGVAVYAQHRDEIQLVVTDMTMPIMDGRAVIRALQRIDPDVRIIAVSGLEDQRAVAAGAGSGTQAFLVKPFEGETLLRTVHEVISAPRGEESP